MKMATEFSTMAVLGLRKGWFERLCRHAALEWNTTPAWGFMLLAAPFLIVAAALASAAVGRDAYIYFTGEDQVAENLQLFLYVAALVLSLQVARRLRTSGERILAAMYVLLSVGFFFLVGEEVSWGQRILGWTTPEALLQINRQQETNLHNLYGIETAVRWAYLLVGAYGAFSPFLAPRTKFWARYCHKIAFLIPPSSLAIYFFPMFVWRIYRNLVPPPEKFSFFISEFNEVFELILAAAFFLFLLFQLRRMRARQRTGTDDEGLSAT